MIFVFGFLAVRFIFRKGGFCVCLILLFMKAGGGMEMWLGKWKR